MKRRTTNSSLLVKLTVLFLSALFVSSTASAFVASSGRSERLTSFLGQECKAIAERKVREDKLDEARLQTVHAGFIVHNEMGINSRRFGEFKCGFMASSFDMTTIILTAGVFLGLGLCITLVLSTQKRKRRQPK